MSGTDWALQKMGVRMVDKFCLHIFSSHKMPKLWGSFIFLGAQSVPPTLASAVNHSFCVSSGHT